MHIIIILGNEALDMTRSQINSHLWNHPGDASAIVENTFGYITAQSILYSTVELPPIKWCDSPHSQSGLSQSLNNARTESYLRTKAVATDAGGDDACDDDIDHYSDCRGKPARMQSASRRHANDPRKISTSQPCPVPSPLTQHSRSFPRTPALPSYGSGCTNYHLIRFDSPRKIRFSLTSWHDWLTTSVFGNLLFVLDDVCQEFPTPFV